MTAILKMIITKFWPVIIPFLLYLMWLSYVRMKNKEGKKIPFGAGPIKQVMYSMIALTFICLFYLLITTSSKDRKFVPTKIEGGVIVPSHVE